MQQEPKKVENKELGELQKKSEEYLNNWKRSAADFINYKKEEMERVGFLAQYAKEDIVQKVLPIFDSFYLAEKVLHPSLQDDGWLAGFLQIKSQISEFLKKEGIEEIEVVGKKFDASTMEIVEEIDLPAQAGGGESGIVAGELQKGYKIGEKVLRPAKIKVSK